MVYPVTRLVNDTIAQVNAALPKLADTFSDNIRDRQPTILRRVVAITAIIPPPPAYPIMSKMTPKQRRKVWALINEQGGPPTVRTGAVLDAYDIAIIPNGSKGEVLLTNNNPAAPYVVGELQQGFHADTGYIKVDTVQPQNEAIVLEEAGYAFDDAVAELI